MYFLTTVIYRSIMQIASHNRGWGEGVGMTYNGGHGSCCNSCNMQFYTHSSVTQYLVHYRITLNENIYCYTYTYTLVCPTFNNLYVTRVHPKLHVLSLIVFERGQSTGRCARGTFGEGGEGVTRVPADPSVFTNNPESQYFFCNLVT